MKWAPGSYSDLARSWEEHFAGRTAWESGDPAEMAKFERFAITGEDADGQPITEYVYKRKAVRVDPKDAPDGEANKA